MRVVLILAVVVLGIATAIVHVDTRRATFCETNQPFYHFPVIEGKAGTPNQYRVLVPWIMQWFLERWYGRGTRVWSMDLAIGTRVVQQIIMFAVLALYLLAWKLKPEMVLGGMGFIASSMMNGVRYADLSYSTYTDIALYLVVALLILKRRYLWTLPVIVLGALNRETSGLMPVLVGSAWFFDKGLRREVILSALVGILLWGGIQLYLHKIFGFQAQNPGYNGMVFPNLWVHNLTHVLGWAIMLLTMGMLPFWAFARWKFLPEKLKIMTLALVPAWTVPHLLGGNFVEARIFLVPLLVCFLPAFLLVFGKGNTSLALLKILDKKGKT
jgi:hypothetical protein